MNGPLIVGEACLKINERVNEVITELKIKATNYEPNSEDHKMLIHCINRLNQLNNEIYSQILGEFIKNISAKSENIETGIMKETIDNVMNAFSVNFSNMSQTKHHDAIDLIKSMDNEDRLREILNLISDPSQLESITQSCSKLCGKQ